MARWIDENLDLTELAKAHWEKHGRPPSDLFAMTPFELMVLFTRRRDDGQVDRLGELYHHNHVFRAQRGLPPAVPPWLMPKVPRR